MTTKNFVVKNGLTVGNTTIDASTGNLTVTNANLGNLATANYFSGSGNMLSNIQAANIFGSISNANYASYAGVVTTNAQPNITSLGTLSSLSVTGNVTAGNVIGPLANGNSNLTIPSVNGNVTISSAGNANVVVVTGTGVNVSGTLNATGNANVGNLGATGVTTTTLSATSNANVGNLNSTGAVVATGNVTGGNLTTAGTLSVTGTGQSSIAGNLTMNDKNIVSLADPVNAQDAATKAYVDSTAQGLDVKASCQLATATALPTYTYNNGTSGVGATITGDSNGALSVDGSVVSAGDRILVKNETSTNAPYNGIYVVTTVGTASAAYVLTRASDFDSGSPSGEIPGAFTFIEQGSTNADTGWVCTTNNPVTVGTTAIGFTQFSGAGSYAAGTGLTLTGTTFSVNTSQPTITSVSSSFSGLTLASNGNITLSGSGSQVTGANVVSATYLTGTLTTASQPNITSLGSLSGLTVTGNATVGNLIGSVANGSSNLSIPVSNGNVAISAAGNANVVVVTGTGVNVFGTLSVSGASDLGAVGNITITGGSSGQYLQTDGSGSLSWQSISTSGVANGNSNVSIPTANGNVNISAAGNANVLTVTGTGVNVSGTLNSTGNANVGNVGAASGVFSGNITAQNASLGNLVTANYFTGTLTTASQPNITSVGNLSNLTIESNGNVTLSGTGSQLSGANLVSATYLTGTLTTASQPNITSVGNLSSLTVSGNTKSNYVALTNGLTSNRSNVSVTTNTVLDQFAPATFRTAKYTISASSANGYQSVETLLVHDGVNSYITIYGSLCSNAVADIVDISSNINGTTGNVTLYATSSGGTATVQMIAQYLLT